MLHMWDYDYKPNGAGYTCQESKYGGSPTTKFYKMERSANDEVVTNIKIYRDWDGEKGSLFEETGNYKTNYLTVTYETTNYDTNGDGAVTEDDGDGIVTEITEEYKMITITY
jgi:hypothetical protein